MLHALSYETLQVFFMLLGGHALGDYALQTEWMATNKNRHIRDHFDESKKLKFQVIWPHLLTAHSLIHGLIVLLITQNLYLGLLETVFHWIIDFGKCEGWYGFHTDQILHVVCKVIWTGALVFPLL